MCLQFVQLNKTFQLGTRYLRSDGIRVNESSQYHIRSHGKENVEYKPVLQSKANNALIALKKIQSRRSYYQNEECIYILKKDIFRVQHLFVQYDNTTQIVKKVSVLKDNLFLLVKLGFYWWFLSVRARAEKTTTKKNDVNVN